MMRKLFLLAAFVASQSLYAQFRVINDAFVETEFEGLTIGIFNEYYSLGSNANIGQWNGKNRQSNRDVFVFSELDKELLRIQFQRKKIKLGYHAHLYSYQRITIGSGLFDMLYGSKNLSNDYRYSYFGNSTFTHSLSAQKRLNKNTRITGFLNLHNVNSFYNLEAMGTNSFSEASPQIVLNTAYTSLNVPHLDQNKSLYTLPNGVGQHDSTHITQVLKAPSSISLSFALTATPTEFSKLHFFVNNLGPSAGVWTQRENNTIQLSENATVLDRQDLFSQGNTVVTTSEIKDSLFIDAESRVSIKGRPRSVGASFEVEQSRLLTIGVGLHGIKYPDFRQFNLLAYGNWKLMEHGYLVSGIQTQNIAGKTLGNLLFGVSFFPTSELKITAQTSTGINYGFYNSELVPRTFSRINHTITAQITLP